MCKFESKECGRRGTMCKFESKEVHGVATASGMRRCVRVMCGPVSARVWNAPRLIVCIAFL